MHEIFVALAPCKSMKKNKVQNYTIREKKKKVEIDFQSWKFESGYPII